MERSGIERDNQLDRGACHIFDGLVDDVEVRFIHKYFRDDYLYTYGNRSGNLSKDEIFFFGKDAVSGIKLSHDPIQKLLLTKITAHLNLEVVNIQDVYLNGQTYDLNGSLHVDTFIDRNTDHNEALNAENTWTILYMVNSTHNDDIGDFSFGPDNNIPFKGGRFIIFDPNCMHCGLGPSIKTDMRITLAWKCIELTDPL